MDRWILRQAMTVSGLNIFGRPASITLKPTDMRGWHWEVGKGVVVPITWDEVRPKAMYHCIAIRYKRRVLAICEHILVLRWLGLDNVVIVSPTLPPYHGCAGGLLKEICSSERPDKGSVARCACDELITVRHDKVENGYIEYQPLKRYEQIALTVVVTINYPALGSYTIKWSSAEPDSLIPMLYAHAQGVSLTQRRILAKLKWPHLDKVAWLGTAEPNALLYAWAKHRLADLLGALALIWGDRLPAGTVISNGAGHEADLQLIAEMLKAGLKPVP